MSETIDVEVISSDTIYIDITEEAPMQIPLEKKKLTRKNERKLSLEMQMWENDRFKLNQAEEHYANVENSTAKAIDTVTKMYFKDIMDQLKSDRKRNIQVKNSIVEKAVEVLMGVWEDGFIKGETDIKKEIASVGLNKSLNISKKQETRKEKIIRKLVNKLFSNVKTNIEVRMESLSDKAVENMGGLDDMLLNFETGFKKEKDNISSVLEGGYIDGRGETLFDLGDELTYFYSSRMDRALCDECAPFDGLILTKSEIEDEGFNFGHPVNPKCLGNLSGTDRCRCILLPYEVKNK
jgi:hypothetical protein